MPPTPRSYWLWESESFAAVAAQNDVTVFCGEWEGWRDENKVFWVDGWLNVQPLTVTHVNCIERNVLNHTDLKWNLNLKVHFISLEPVPRIE